ncbi:F0F1 ATP synthase subunit B [Pseudonocardia asaccharolytica]|uniref:ATP synthase subunit b n=1 Tax=Pseudonocardia asaccharolytica DSM 44247 = NBRC 16224 TaxID=1123024 RepID=A0A511D344_9PSEU|nr:F0F1 ATP synthase subunit B [Pseudonocardia asaccharolytica]GEL18943.1 ATP synthase subunit b [Pseudonocardia asaccharolytica DSM 44247 = NBRC 16224]
MTTTLLAAEELNPLAPHPIEIIVGLIAFLLLFWLLKRTVFPQFEKVYAERVDKIEGGIKRAEEAQEEAYVLRQQYEDQLAGLRAEAARIRDDARAEGQQIKAELRAQAEEEAERIRQRGHEQIAAAREQVARQLRAEIGGISVQLAERLVGRELSAETRRTETIDAFLAELDELAERRETAPAAGGAS